MKKLIMLLGMLMLSGYANAANSEILTIKFDLTDNQAKCTYMFFAEDNKLRYEANPISINHCPRSLDLGTSSVNSISVTIPVTNVMIDGNAKTCTVKINRLADNSPYVYSFENSDRNCSDKVKVKLHEPKHS